MTSFGIVTSPEQVVPSIKIPFTITSGFPCCSFVNQAVPENAPSPMLVTLLGIVMLAKLLQPENAELPMLVTLFGMTMLVKLLQPENISHSILVTLFGMIMLVKLLQLENTKNPMLLN